jgi:hypothetical protein
MVPGIHQLILKVLETFIDFLARPVKDPPKVTQCKRFRAPEVVDENESANIFEEVTFGPRSPGELSGKDTVSGYASFKVIWNGPQIL